MGISWDIQHDVFFVIMILSHVSKRDLKKKKQNQCPICFVRLSDAWNSHSSIGKMDIS